MSEVRWIVDPTEPFWLCQTEGLDFVICIGYDKTLKQYLYRVYGGGAVVPEQVILPAAITTTQEACARAVLECMRDLQKAELKLLKLSGRKLPKIVTPRMDLDNF